MLSIVHILLDVSVLLELVSCGLIHLLLSSLGLLQLDTLHPLLWGLVGILFIFVLNDRNLLVKNFACLSECLTLGCNIVRHHFLHSGHVQEVSDRRTVLGVFCK